MISKNRIKLIHSLEQKKFRKREGLFVAEGPKLVGELLSVLDLEYCAALPDWLDQHQHQLSREAEVQVATEDELQRASLLKNPQEVIALFRIPQYQNVLAEEADTSLVLALDGVQDPGNLGTIIRLADWFGIEDVYCSMETVDVYNPKAIQATMGAISRVRVHYIDLYHELCQVKSPIYGTHLDGDNIYEQKLEQHGVIVMGNEGNGVSQEVSSRVTHRLFIPPYPADRSTVESLNVAIATAIVCAEFRRR